MGNNVIVTGKITGLEAVERNIAEREQKIIENVSKVVVAVARHGADLMRQSILTAHSPSPPGSPPGIVTGTLLGSIQTEHEGGTIEATIRVKAPHAHLLEFGTRKMAARPFIRHNGRAAGAEGEILIEAAVRGV